MKTDERAEAGRRHAPPSHEISCHTCGAKIITAAPCVADGDALKMAARVAELEQVLETVRRQEAYRNRRAALAARIAKGDLCRRCGGATRACISRPGAVCDKCGLLVAGE